MGLDLLEHWVNCYAPIPAETWPLSAGFEDYEPVSPDGYYGFAEPHFHKGSQDHCFCDPTVPDGAERLAEREAEEEVWEPGDLDGTVRGAVRFVTGFSDAEL